jgi:spore maturation protein CgeB
MPFAKHPKLNIHSELRGTSYEEVMANSKFSLNILYPNKQSFSERIGYTLLNGAVCVCDESSYMKQLFQDKEEMLFYRLDRLEQLPDMIKRYLVCPEQAQMISAAGRKKALEKHTWAVRAEQFLQILCGVDT